VVTFGAFAEYVVIIFFSLLLLFFLLLYFTYIFGRIPSLFSVAFIDNFGWLWCSRQRC